MTSMGREHGQPVKDLGDRFKNTSAMNRYNKIFRLQNVTVEQQVALTDFKDLNLPHIFQSRGWKSLVGPHEYANIQIVRGFYANIPPFFPDQQNPPNLRGRYQVNEDDDTLHFSTGNKYPDSFDVYLRGKTLTFSVARIAELLQLPTKPDPPGFPSLVDKLDMKFLTSRLVANPRVRILKEQNMSEFYRVLVQIVRSNIDPPPYRIPHDLISLDRARLLYAIGNNVSIDLATYIFRAICHAAFPRAMPEFLPFASLITRFATASKVRDDPTDRPSFNWVPLNNDSVFCYVRVPSSHAHAPTPASKPRPPKPNKRPAERHGTNLLANDIDKSRGDVCAIETHSPSPSGIPPSSKQPCAANPASVPASKPSPPQLNQPPAVRHGTSLLTNDVAKLRGDVHAIYMQSDVSPSSKRPSAEIVDAEERNNGNLIPDADAIINLSTSTCDSHPKKKAKKDSLEHVLGEVGKSLNEFLASQMKMKLRAEEVLGVVSKIPDLSRLQVFKALRIILSSNPEEFSILKTFPDAEKTEWILFLISQSEGSRVASSFCS